MPKFDNETQAKLLENHTVLAIDFDVQGERRTCRIWLPDEIYHEVPDEIRTRMNKDLAEALSFGEIEDDLDFIGHMDVVDATVTRRSSRTEELALLALILNLLSERSSRRRSRLSGRTPNLSDYYTRPTPEKVIELYQKEGIKSITQQSNIYADIGILGLYLFDDRDWRTLRYIPMSDAGVDLVVDLVKAFKEGVDPKDTGLDMSEYLFKVLTAYQNLKTPPDIS